MKKYRSELQRVAEANIRADGLYSVPKTVFWYKASIVMAVAGWVALLLFFSEYGFY